MNILQFACTYMTCIMHVCYTHECVHYLIFTLVLLYFKDETVTAGHWGGRSMCFRCPCCWRKLRNWVSKWAEFVFFILDFLYSKVGNFNNFNREDENPYIPQDGRPNLTAGIPIQRHGLTNSHAVRRCVLDITCCIESAVSIVRTVGLKLCQLGLLVVIISSGLSCSQPYWIGPIAYPFFWGGLGFYPLYRYIMSISAIGRSTSVLPRVLLDRPRRRRMAGWLGALLQHAARRSSEVDWCAASGGIHCTLQCYLG